jgi:phenylacetate-coenzyme A ligase PaaK-like adenylate-forming protein
MRTTPLQPWIAATVGTPGPELDRRDLERYQLTRLRATIALATQRSPLYRTLLAGVPAPERLADLRRFPFTTPSDVAAHGRRLVCVPQDDIARVVTLDTSGTTGAPKRLWFTAADQRLTVDFFRVGMSTFTGPGDRVLILLPGERPGGVGDLLATAVENLRAEPIRHGVVQDVVGTLDVLHERDVDVLVGIPVQVLALARADATVRPKAVLLSTDHVPLALIRAVERAWGCTVYGHYGMTEMGLGGGVECDARRGYHLREADLLVEIVDPVTGDPMADGDEGEVVFTTLTREGMPLIRYRTGDLSRFLPGRCPCGTSLRTLERLTRRVEGVRTLHGCGTLALADLDEALFAVDGVLDFEATLTPGPAKDRLALVVRTTAATGDAATSGALAAALDDAVEQHLVVRRARARFRLDVEITVLPPGPVAPPVKRRMRVVIGDA